MGDGTKDYVFGVNEEGQFKLDPVKNGQEISLTIPVRVGIGKHKVYWSVHDQCGNFSTCNTLIETKDLKSPTPYMHGFLTTAFQGDVMQLTIPSNCFNISSFDNCTPSSRLKYSFSPNVNDTLRTIDCTNTGFQFYTIYVTDESGNNDFVEVFMIAFDNGSCSFSGSFGGKVNEANGKPMKDVEMTLERPGQPYVAALSDQQGIFNWNDISMYSDYQISPKYNTVQEGRVDVADLKKMQNYFFGLDSLVNFQYLAADVNGDYKIRINDLELIKSKILHPLKAVGSNWLFAVDVDSINDVNDLKKIRPVFDIMKFDGSIDFKMVYSGDITGANSIETSNRNSFSAEEKIEGNKYHLISTSDVACHGLQMEIEVEAKLFDQISIKSPYFSIPENAFVKDVLSNSIRLVSTIAFNAEAGKPFLTITFDDTIEENICKISQASKILLPNYRIAELRMEKPYMDDSSIQILPNPSEGQFELSSDNAKVIKVYDQQGRDVPFRNSGKIVSISANPGLYFISVDVNGDRVVRKLIVY
ncbi:MAG: T9SS type A sorting domain-containing protein [Saprospiraceae bacterium]|nr:T9SS type A sorting domain-containing protein [Saprospiraceae bacterium]